MMFFLFTLLNDLVLIAASDIDLFPLENIQVTIGSEDLKANHSIRQIVEIMSESQKYNKYDELISFLFVC